jgi:hypothetical protein
MATRVDLILFKTPRTTRQGNSTRTSLILTQVQKFLGLKSRHVCFSPCAPFTFVRRWDVQPMHSVLCFGQAGLCTSRFRLCGSKLCLRTSCWPHLGPEITGVDSRRSHVEYVILFKTVREKVCTTSLTSVLDNKWSNTTNATWQIVCAEKLDQQHHLKNGPDWNTI